MHLDVPDPDTGARMRLDIQVNPAQTFGGIWLTVWAQFLGLFVRDPALGKLWRFRRVSRSWRDGIPECLERHPFARSVVTAWMDQTIAARLSVLTQLHSLGSCSEFFVGQASRMATLDRDPSVREAATQVVLSLGPSTCTRCCSKSACNGSSAICRC